MQDAADDVVFIHGLQGDLQTCLLGIADFAHRAVQVDAGGAIEGDEHLGAWTCGDGACALHAILGVPSPRSGEVSSPGARASIAEGLPETLAAFSTLCLLACQCPGASENHVGGSCNPSCQKSHTQFQFNIG